MSYELIFTKEAENDIKALKRGEPQSYKKLSLLFLELIEHPKTGTGKPEILKKTDGIYSRRITQKHRLIYSVRDELVTVIIISAYGHY